MSDNLLEVNSITKNFGGVKALSEVSLFVKRGEVLALAGDNGAGKSTLIKIISGVYHQDDGEIIYDGTNLNISNPKFARNLGIETIYQDLALADNLNVGANIFLGREPLLNLFGLVKILDQKKMLSESRQILDSLDIEIPEISLGHPVRRLSGGQRQRLGIARILFHNKDILIFDEATNALDKETEKEIFDFIYSLKGKKTIIISTHSLDMLYDCDQVYEIKNNTLSKIK